jgi:hypothetical protein
MEPAGRFLGDAAMLLAEHERARALYAKTLEGAEQLGFRPEVAVLRLRLAELLLEHFSSERSEALAHLDFATKEFGAMKMQPSLEQALQCQQRLRP